MRCVLLALLPAVFVSALAAQHPNRTPVRSASLAATPAAAPNAAQSAVSDLPVRKVVLYKNGVGYFEHAGTVNGNQRVAIDFTSSQLNDVLQSLTALDSKGGRISAVNYNSTTPVEQQLNSLSLGLNDNPDVAAVYQALRGQRVEVTGAGAPMEGRLVNIESRTVTDKNGNSSDDHYYLIVEVDSGALRTAEITDALSVHMLDPSLEKQFASYLEIIASAENQQGRHLTLDDRGEGERQLQVSYISEVPVWKSTYRIVFPQEANGNATVQGWAVVDNTVGVDWNNVQLSLVAGAPQSFIQPLSQPLYTQRPTIPIATVGQNMPTRHEAAEAMAQDRIEMSAKLMAPRAMQTVTVDAAPQAMAGPMSAGVMGRLKSGSGNGMMGSGFGSGSGAGYGGGVYRPSDAIQEGDVSSNAFDDFFEYALTQPATIHKNESAMVPILQQELPANHVTLWSDTEPRPLRAIWLENSSKLTLDSGSFSIFENGEFAGEGLLDPIHPGEKRLLSYAVDQAVKVRRGGSSDTRTLRHIAMHQGVMVETTSEVTDSAYTVNNAADEKRDVVVEHARQPNSELTSDTKPAETTASAYRFQVGVEPHQSADLHVTERTNLSEKIRIGPQFNNGDFLMTIGKYSPELEEKLRPAIDAQTALADVNRKIVENDEHQKALADDETRDRDNLTALKGNDAAKRFVDELNKAEDQLQTARKEEADLEKQRDAARAQLDSIIAKLSFDTDLDVVTSKSN
ncbi:conserved exported hypothetical protein [Candidatus Sulfotelmatomonas gaucii]|uniref:DUF4139 domain-containing protein n=1 Tax=Candidatus Sulfuritelmatomonas gaucii TaxID=2043161 RepID=A0A2N9LEC6_9BACT|nr:conserved exported hypothetical protein [Candidatus Sulfotelmatomonas gaucii]